MTCIASLVPDELFSGLVEHGRHCQQHVHLVGCEVLQNAHGADWKPVGVELHRGQVIGVLSTAQLVVCSAVHGGKNVILVA